MATICAPTLQACRLRLTRLDNCGRPVAGPKSVIVPGSDRGTGFISIGLTFENEDGEEFIQADSCGNLCINQTACDKFKRVTADINWCIYNPEVIELVTGNQLLLDGTGNAAGVAFGDYGQCDGGWSLEWWQKLAGASCDAAGEPMWNYWALTNLGLGTMSDLTFENGAFTFSTTADSRAIETDNQWGTNNLGPFATLPASAEPAIGTHLVQFFTTVQPPVPNAASCDAFAYVAA